MPTFQISLYSLKLVFPIVECQGKIDRHSNMEALLMVN